jgi:hypothetical protein
MVSGTLGSEPSWSVGGSGYVGLLDSTPCRTRDVSTLVAAPVDRLSAHTGSFGPRDGVVAFKVRAGEGSRRVSGSGVGFPPFSFERFERHLGT